MPLGPWFARSVMLLLNGGVSRLDKAISLGYLQCFLTLSERREKVAISATLADSRLCMESKTWQLLDAFTTRGTGLNS